MRNRWLGFVVAAVALALGMWAWPRLPARVPIHWNIHGVPDGYSSRVVAVLLMPGIVLALNGLFRVLPGLDPRRVNYEKFQDTYWLIANGLGYPVAMARLMPLGIGLLFIVLGNSLARVQPTWFVGIRTPWTLSSDTVWRKTHRTGGFTFVIAGVVMLTAAFVSGPLVWILLAAAAVLAVAVPVVQSYVLWRREQHEKP